MDTNDGITANQLFKSTLLIFTEQFRIPIMVKEQDKIVLKCINIHSGSDLRLRAGCLMGYGNTNFWSK